MSVASVIFSWVSFCLFLMCGKGGKTISNLPQPWRIVPFAIIFNLVFVILSSVSVEFTFGGFSSFCSSIVQNVNLAGGKVSSCDELDDYNLKLKDTANNDKYDVGNFYDNVVIAQVRSN